MSFHEKYAWFRLAFCLSMFALLAMAVVSPADAEAAWDRTRSIVTIFICGYLLIGGGVGLHGRRPPRRLEDERDLAIARRARGVALFALCFACYWLAMTLAEREWPAGAITATVAAQWILAMLPLALALEAGTSAVLYWRDRRDDSCDDRGASDR
jgi:hypothetical protein